MKDNIKQTRLHSIVEVLANASIGYMVAVLTQLIVLPWYGITLGVMDNASLALIFTIVSIVRSYVIRRWFNNLNKRIDGAIWWVINKVKQPEALHTPNYDGVKGTLREELERLSALQPPKILYNAVQTPDGTIITSRHQHDYVEYLDENGTTYMVDGGLTYYRRGGDGKEVDLSVTTDDEHEVIRTCFEWGTYGVLGDEPLHHIKLRDMTIQHIKAVLKSQTLAPHIKDIFENEFEFRTWTGQVK